MHLTVIICTYNRCEGLRTCLTDLREQSVDLDIDWEVLVVDNNSTDSTQAVLQTLSRDFPRPLRWVKETKQGLSHARNRGVLEASGRYVVFTEDDVRIDRLWVTSICEMFAKSSCDAVAGRIELFWTAPRPRWLTDELLGFLGYLDYGEERALTEDTPFFGGNMAFARSVFEKIGMFDPNLGRQGRKLIGGEEIDLYKRFLAAGMRAFYQPKAVIHHIIDSRRLRKGYFRSLHYQEGRLRGDAFVMTDGKSIAGVPLFLLPQFGQSVCKCVQTVWRDGAHRSLRTEMNVWYFVGFLMGCVERRFGQQNILPT
jgi:glycosyltransferase involved in cell wall biosynthesis